MTNHINIPRAKVRLRYRYDASGLPRDRVWRVTLKDGTREFYAAEFARVEYATAMTYAHNLSADRAAVRVKEIQAELKTYQGAHND